MPTRERVPAERRADPVLVYRGEPGSPQLFALRPGLRRVTIGRGPANHIALGWDTQVSRVHVELERVGAEWTVIDEGLSGTGTWVNGERLSGRQRLRDGDVLKVGATQIAFRVPPAKKSRRAAAGSRPRVPQLTPTQAKILEALCRPYQESEFALPASDPAIAEELFLSADAVRAHLRALFVAFDVQDVPQGQRRAALAVRAIKLGIVGA